MGWCCKARVSYIVPMGFMAPTDTFFAAHQVFLESVWVQMGLFAHRGFSLAVQFCLFFKKPSALAAAATIEQKSSLCD